MKIRNDFVSNSSSSSFIISKQKGLVDFFVEFRKIISDLHHIIFCWYDRETRDIAYNYLINNHQIKNYLTDHVSWIDKHYDYNWNGKQMYCILINGEVLKEPFNDDIIALVANCNNVIIELMETWDSFPLSRISQILTLLEYKGFAYETITSHLDWFKMNEEITNNEN